VRANSLPVHLHEVGMKKPGLTPKPVPQRTCVACRRSDAKRGLIRLVRTTDGQVEVDETGKRQGRGAYLCRDIACWEAALKRKALERALRLDTLSATNREQLVSFMDQLAVT
jgi:uncharacterized protein